MLCRRVSPYIELEPLKNRFGILVSIGGEEMKQTYTAVVKQDASWWFGWIEEVPGVNCQESTRAELVESLHVTLAEAIEFNRIEARSAAGIGYEELPIAV